MVVLRDSSNINRPKVTSWISSQSGPSLLWYSAPAANGKSMLSAFMTRHFKSFANGCQCFHLKFADPHKRTAADCLCALTFQLARDVPSFGNLLCESFDSLGLDSGQAGLIWRHAFERYLPKAGIQGYLHWVIDGLDECDAPKALLDCLKDLSALGLPIRIMIFSRNLDSLAVAFDHLARAVPVAAVEGSGNYHNQRDIDVLVSRELQHFRGNEEFREKLRNNITARCEDNFLWTKLVLEEHLDCHTEESIQEVLEEIPDDMNSLYQRMEVSLTRPTRKSNTPK